MADEATSTAQQEAITASVPEGTATAPEKIYTQADVDNAVEGRLARERKKFPPKEELEAYRAWKDGQQTEAEKQRQILEERNGFETQIGQLTNDLEQLKREKMLLSRGVPEEDVDYYVFKIGKLVSESVTFERAAENVLKDRAKQGAQPPAGVVSTGLQMSAPPAESLAERINRQIRGLK